MAKTSKKKTKAPKVKVEEPKPETVSAKNKILSKVKQHRIASIIILIVALLFVLLAYGYLNTRSQLNKLSDPKSAGSTEVQQLTSSIDKYINLPQETPTLATVKDVSKLQGQQFFQDAQNGDKVLIFPKAGKAVIIRPSTNKVIEFSQVSITDPQQ